MRNPTICGKNRINLPESGCSECDELEYRISQIERNVVKYSLESDGNTITLVGSDGTSSSVAVISTASCGSTSNSEELTPIIPIEVER